MKHKKKLEKLAALQASYDAMIIRLGAKVHPGQYHRPGSIKAR